MGRRTGLKSPKKSQQASTRQQHYARGPAWGTKTYDQRKHQRRRELRPIPNAVLGAADVPDGGAANADVVGAMLSLSQQANAKLASAEIAAALSADDRSLLESAVNRLLRPHQPAAGQAGGLQRSNSGNKAITDLLDVLRKLGQQLQQTKQEAEQKIEGLE